MMHILQISDKRFEENIKFEPKIKTFLFKIMQLSELFNRLDSLHSHICTYFDFCNLI